MSGKFCYRPLVLNVISFCPVKQHFEHDEFAWITNEKKSTLTFLYVSIRNSPDDELMLIWFCELNETHYCEETTVVLVDSKQ